MKKLVPIAEQHPSYRIDSILILYIYTTVRTPDMAQRAFNHWFNTLADPTYTDRYRRKKKLRQRTSPSGNYQIDEDVWARHPADDVMYIASVIALLINHDILAV